MFQGFSIQKSCSYAHRLGFIGSHTYSLLLGSKTLGTKCIRTSICNVLANHDHNLESRFRLLKVCLFVKLELSKLQDLLAKSAMFDRSKIRLDRSNFVQITFL